MADDHSPTRTSGPPSPALSGGLTRGELDELAIELEAFDREFDGRVSLGCTVRVATDGGRVADYVLVGRRSDGASPREVSSGSPVGQALLGARPGQVVRVELPDGRDRDLHVLAVTPPVHVEMAVAASLGAQAA